MSQSPEFGGELATLNLGGVAPRPKKYTPGLSASQFEAAFAELVHEAIEPGLTALGGELESPGFRGMLTALHPENPLTRPQDYSGPHRKTRYPELNARLGPSYDAVATEPSDSLKLASEAHEAVEKWYEFFLGDRPTAPDDYWQETTDDWRRISDQLGANPGMLLDRFAKRNGWKKDRTAKVVSKARRDSIQSDQAMLPYALLTMAFRALPEDARASFSELIGDHLGTARDAFEYAGVDLEAPQENGMDGFIADSIQSSIDQFDAVSFSSPAAKDAYIACMHMLGKFFTPPCTEKDHAFVEAYTEQAMTTYVRDGLGASAFRMNAESIIDSAEARAVRLAIELGIDESGVRGFSANFIQRYREQSLGGVGYTRHNALNQFPAFVETVNRERTRFLVEFQCLLQAQQLVAGIMAETFSPDQLDRALAIANEKPVQDLIDRKMEIERLYKEWEVVWVIAPPSEGSRGAKGSLVERAVGKTAATGSVDESREEWLKEYIRMWGGGVIVRSKFPNRRARKQYLIALLARESADGEVMWTAIADSKYDPGSNALLVWLPEAGMDAHDRLLTKWYTVFQLKKGTLPDVGVYRMLHTPTLRKRIKKLLETPAEKIPRFGNLGAIALKAQRDAERAKRGGLDEEDEDYDE